MPEGNEVTRRSFIQAGALTTSAVAMTAKSYAQVSGANNHLRAGIIGCGGIGGSHLRAMQSLIVDDNIDIGAVCDVYVDRAESFRDRINETGGEARASNDYRDVLADPDIDYVVICTPEHSHHYLAMAALDAGKHVYCEKPLCYDIREAKEVVAKAKETGLQLQVGVQGMADDSYASAQDAIRAGKIGQVVQAQIEYVRNYPADRGPWRGNATATDPQPSTLNWEAWLYPREPKPWDARHYREWRCYRDYSGGIATDLFVHRVTRIIRACGLTFPTRVAGLGGIYVWDDGRDLPDNMEMLLEYPAVPGISEGMTVHLLGTMANDRGIDHCIRGTTGTLLFTRDGWEIVNQESGEVVERHKKTGGEDMRLHHMNHHAAIRDGVPLNCPPELGLYGVVASRMGNLSWLQRKLVGWDFEREYVIAL
jgi:predicted dehydrogenase